MTAFHFPAPMVARFQKVYHVYQNRPYVFGDLVAFIPPGERAIGVAQINAPQASLWRPFGARKVIEVTLDESKEELYARGIHFVIVSEEALSWHDHLTSADLAVQWSGSIVAKKSLTLLASQPPEVWYVFSL